MAPETIKIFIGCDPNNCDLEQMMVLDYSIQKHTQQPYEITWMQLSKDPSSPWYSDHDIKKGWLTEKWATPFSGFRWAIPEYCDFKGRAIYMDADVIVLCDIAELWHHEMNDQSIVIAKGDKKSARLCTCVWNCEKAKQYLLPLSTLQSDINSHQKMMQLIKDQPQLVTPYQDSYNCIDGEALGIEQIKILHYSDMGTQFSHKYSIPRLIGAGQKHWFDGKIIPHPRSDLSELYDQYYNEALTNGFKPGDYKITNFGNFLKATQHLYRGNKVTRGSSNKNVFTKIVSKFKKKFKKERFSLEDQ